MKYLLKVLTVLVILSLSIFISCNKNKNKKKDPIPDDPRDAIGMSLEGSWSPTSVKLDGFPRTEWDGFTISIATYNVDNDVSSYSVSNLPTNEGADEVWGAESETVSWNFNADDFSIIERTGLPDLSFQLNEAETELTVLTTITDAPIRGFNGDWEFVFTK